MDLWSILNTNLVSSLLGSALFAIIAGLALHQLLGDRERKSLKKQISLILTEPINTNIESCDILIGQLRERSITMVPNPFDITPLQVILQGKFVEVMSPDLVSKVATAYRYCIIVNSHFDRMTELTAGSASSLTNSNNTRDSLIKECLVMIPVAKTAHLQVKNLLQGVPANSSL